MTGVSGSSDNWVQSEVRAFKKGVPVEEAVTPPSSWYTSPDILNLELEKIFERRWLAVGKHFFSENRSSVWKPEKLFEGRALLPCISYALFSKD